MKHHFILAILVVFGMLVVFTIQHNVKLRDDDLAVTEGEVSVLEGQRQALRDALQFIAKRDEQSIVANTRGIIVQVGGNAEVLEWDPDFLVGKHMNILRPQRRRKIHTSQYQSRADEGATGEIHFFEDGAAISQSGKEFEVDGLVFFDAKKELFYGFFAR